MNAYASAQRILFDQNIIDAHCDDFKEGPIKFGKVKAKCALLHKTNKQELVTIPRYAHKYKYFIVVFCKNNGKSERANRQDDVYVYSMKDIKSTLGRSNGMMDFRNFPLALDDDQLRALAK
jgi:hypothetical protein